MASLTVTCDHCGEPLVGAVNRCWKCGTVQEKVEHEAIPPVRRTAVLVEYLVPDEQTQEPIAAEVIENEPEGLASKVLSRLAMFDSVGWSSLAAGLLALLVVCFYDFGVLLSVPAIVYSSWAIHREWSNLRATGLIVAVICTFGSFTRFVGWLFVWSTGMNMWTLMFN